jgi:hypothetical protein
LTRTGRRDEAIGVLHEAIAIRPGDTIERIDLPDLTWIQSELADHYAECGLVDEAIAACRAALRTDEKLAAAWCKLGGLLRVKRRFREALDANQRGHELGLGHPGWDRPSAQWVEECRELAENEDRVKAIVASGAMPEPEDLPACAAVALEAGDAATAARWYLAASESQYSGIMADPEVGHRFRAACAAALLSLEPGPDSRPALDTESAAWRGRALGWMRTDLDAWRAIRRTSAEVVYARIRLRAWIGDPMLESLRNPGKRSALPSTERDQWAGAFADVAVLLEALR